MSDAVTDTELVQAYKKVYKEAFRDRDSLRRVLAESMDLEELRDHHHNDALHSWVMQTDRNGRIQDTPRGLIQATGFIHQMPGAKQAWNAPFYAPFKQLGNVTLKTQHFNAVVLWAMVLLLFFLLANRIPEKMGNRGVNRS